MVRENSRQYTFENDTEDDLFLVESFLSASSEPISPLYAMETEKEVRVSDLATARGDSGGVVGRFVYQSHQSLSKHLEVQPAWIWLSGRASRLTCCESFLLKTWPSRRVAHFIHCEIALFENSVRNYLLW